MSSRRNVNFNRCRIYIQLNNNLGADVTRSSYTVIFKRMSTVKGHHVVVYPFSIKYVLIFKILALKALNILETFVTVLDKLVPDTEC